jgi:DNA invertase Pin-like site-specific DNA recombinase
MSEIILRVSTDRQGRSGLGLDAQREAIRRFAEAENRKLADEYAEVETGKGVDALELRPQLRLALDNARRLRCPIVVAKLDRLSRDVAFIAGLISVLALRPQRPSQSPHPSPCQVQGRGGAPALIDARLEDGDDWSSN